MLFNSLEFAIFFPVVVLLHFALPCRWRTPLLLVASCIFYMAFIPAYITILAVTIIIDYIAGLYLEDATGRRKKYLLIMSVLSTCVVLAVFKYFYFVSNNVTAMAGLFGWRLTGPSMSIILPIGLSFHTFQSLSYVIEVYRGRQKAEKNFVTYATYVMFFPQLVAGPIERPQNLLHQFYETHALDLARVASGLKRMAWGFFKKLVVADRLSLYVNDVYSAPTQHSGLQSLIATFFFAYQIYCDFSGYSDIAIGSARILGFRLMENFDRPYAARSVGEFWKRWHISLSTWFRDYVYIPLGGNRASSKRWVSNILITFGLSGLWHGASWTFVIWGLLNGVYLVVGRFTENVRTKAFADVGAGPQSWVRQATQVATTFFLTCVAWVFFRASSPGAAIDVLRGWMSGWSMNALSTEHFLMRYLPVAVFALLTLEAGQWLAHRKWPDRVLGRLPTPVRLCSYSAFVLLVVMFGVYQRQPFIYFQF